MNEYTKIAIRQCKEQIEFELKVINRLSEELKQRRNEYQCQLFSSMITKKTHVINDCLNAIVSLTTIA